MRLSNDQLDKNPYEEWMEQERQRRLKQEAEDEEGYEVNWFGLILFLSCIGAYAIYFLFFH